MDNFRIEPWMSPSERAGREYKRRGTIPKPLRPYQVHVELTADEMVELNKLDVNTRRTRFREIQITRQKSA